MFLDPKTSSYFFILTTLLGEVLFFPFASRGNGILRGDITSGYLSQ